MVCGYGKDERWRGWILKEGNLLSVDDLESQLRLGRHQMRYAGMAD